MESADNKKNVGYQLALWSLMFLIVTPIASILLEGTFFYGNIFRSGTTPQESLSQLILHLLLQMAQISLAGAAIIVSIKNHSSKGLIAGLTSLIIGVIIFILVGLN